MILASNSPRSMVRSTILFLFGSLIAAVPSSAQSPDLSQIVQQCQTGTEPACALLQQSSPIASPFSQQVLQPAEPFRTGQTDLQQQSPTAPPKKRKPAPTTEFEQMVSDSIGKKLPIFGLSLFETSPTTFAPVSGVPVPANYVIGPGDEIDVRVWGQINLNVRATVDRNGDIYIPQIGSVNVAGVQYANLEQRLKTEFSRVFKNFQLAASLGRLRSVQVFVVGEAADPGQYTVSSLSTLVNAIFTSGGPTPNGSLRTIQLKRGSQVVTEMDLYALLINGDKSKDVPIQPGDVIFFPPAQGFAAVSGSVSAPAIYEIRPDTTLAVLIRDAGGPTVVADNQRISVERIEDNGTRSVTEVTLAKAKSFKVLKGDIVRMLSLVPRFDNTVTLRGNVANPGRYQWKPGMRISDLIPNPSTLLTREYWLRQAGLTNGRATEYPVKKQQSARDIADSSGQNFVDSAQQTDAQPKPPSGGQAGRSSGSGAVTGQSNSQQGTTGDNPDEPRQPMVHVPNESTLDLEIRRSAPEINWDYALVQRVNPVDLTTKLITFDLGKAIIDKDQASDIELDSGDIVTIFSQKDISVSQSRRTQFVKIEGEVRAPGIYHIGSQDTLQTLVSKAGGLAPGAYLYGSQLTRNSVQEQQQRSLEDFIKLISVQMQQTASASANGNPEQAATLQARTAAQQQFVASLRELRAPGRVVLELKPTAQSADQLPPIALEDGDRFIIPHRPAVVNVIGAVYNQGSFLFTPRRRVSDYFGLAGRNTPIADKKRMFIICADGSVISKQGGGGAWKGSFDKYRLQPGDTLVVPSKLEIGMFQRNLRDWTQIFSQLALTAASLAVVSKQ
jgi:polysaccharide biosynthesis/export protein